MRASSGKILRIDLSTNKISIESSAKYFKHYLGGRGVNQRLLFEGLCPEVSAFDPENMIVVGTGPLVGTLAPAACRLSIDSKNTLTDGIGSANCGGFFAPELRFAGYNHIVVKGKARKPVYLFIDDYQVKIKDASRIWGRTTWETEELLKEEIRDYDIQMICIGPAGENLVRGACIMTNRANAAGRCGLGAVMGSKKLKALVVRGTGQIEVVDPKSFVKVVDDILEKLKKCDFLKKRGDYGIYADARTFKETPWRNYQSGYMPKPDEIASIHPNVFRNEYKIKSLACFNCPVHCRILYEIKHGSYAGTLAEGLENNDISLFALKLNVLNPAAILKLRSLCNQYGLDTDNSVGVIAWAFECYQRKIITMEDTNGLELKWGEDEVVAELLRNIAYRKGFGNVLAEGSKRASEIIRRGSERYAIHVKGQDLEETLWSDKAWALGVVVSARGGTHTRAPVYASRFRTLSPDLCKKFFGVRTVTESTEYEGKPELVVFFERVTAVEDCLGICQFPTLTNAPPPNVLLPEDLVKLLSTATGLKIDVKELMIFGERICNLEKALNVLYAGWTRKDDYPPRRFIDEPVKAFPLKRERLHEDKWDRMLNEYYELHGWEKESSWPTRKTLKNLNLEDVAVNLEKVGRLPD